MATSPSRMSTTLPANTSTSLAEDGRKWSSLDAHQQGPEPFQSIPAQELLKDSCSKCGWIRKEGGSVKSCESLHLVSCVICTELILVTSYCASVCMKPFSLYMACCLELQVSWKLRFLMSNPPSLFSLNKIAKIKVYSKTMVIFTYGYSIVSLCIVCSLTQFYLSIGYYHTYWCASLCHCT